MIENAILSDCAKYRYMLYRQWDQNPAMVFIMLNPSTADHEFDDPTIKRCMEFAKREGCGGIVVANLFAYRATDPRELKCVADPVGPDNPFYLSGVLMSAGPIVVAWGAKGSYLSRADRVAEHAARMRRPLMCLDMNKDGSPKHPLYVAGDTPLKEWKHAV